MSFKKIINKKELDFATTLKQYNPVLKQAIENIIDNLFREIQAPVSCKKKNRCRQPLQQLDRYHNVFGFSAYYSIVCTYVHKQVVWRYIDQGPMQSTFLYTQSEWDQDPGSVKPNL